jgi:hypothetical protein
MCLYICIPRSLLPSPDKQQQYSLTFIAVVVTRSFFFYPEIVDVERKKIEKERRKKKLNEKNLVA